jgi:hypothetical protein
MRLFHRLTFLIVIAAAFAACTPEKSGRPVTSAIDAAPVEPIWLPPDGQPIRWRALLVAGDNREAAFDNAAQAMARMLRTAGVAENDIVVLSAYEKQTGLSADFNSIAMRAKASTIKPGEGCLVFMTAHGSQNGLYMRGNNNYYHLSPGALNGLVNDFCKQAPTVIFTSACYSGVFAQTPMPAPNRAIYTAARRDRTSFGCDAQLEFTFFDYCLMSSLPQVKDWQQLHNRITRCVQRRETQINARASEPQVVLGEAIRDLPPPQLPMQAIAAMWEVVPHQLTVANALPFGGSAGQRELERYKKASGHKALAVGPAGGWAWLNSSAEQDASQQALATCRQRTGRECLLYAVGSRIVWHESIEARLRSGDATAVALLQTD